MTSRSPGCGASSRGARRWSRGCAAPSPTGKYGSALRVRTSLVLLLALLCGCAHAPPGGLVFGVLGDTPYTASEVQRLDALIEDINRERLDFVLHVGDIGSNACDGAT